MPCRGAFGNTRVYRSHFGGGQQRRQSAQQPAASDQSRAVLGLLQFLPIALIILYSMFQGEGSGSGGQAGPGGAGRGPEAGGLPYICSAPGTTPAAKPLFTAS